MAGRQSIKVVFSYAHKNENHHRRLAAQLDRLREDRKIDSWDDREILAGTDWDTEIEDRFSDADIILLLVSKEFLGSEYVQQKEIPQAVAQARSGTSQLVPVILEKCEWQSIEGLSAWQALPPTATPISEWPSKDVAYAAVARGIRALAESLKSGIHEMVERTQRSRMLAIFPQYPFRILGEDYDPFHAFEQVFRRVENHQLEALPPLPLAVPLAERVEFVASDYRSILTELRHGDAETGLPYDVVAVPYWTLGHCVEKGLIQPLESELLDVLKEGHTWWREMGLYRNQLYGVPLSALTMVLAIREDLFEEHGLEPPDSWEDYFALIDHVKAHPIVDAAGRTIAPELLQGRSHITLWYDWLSHLYAHNANDRELYGGNRFNARRAAETLRAGTASYLELAARLAGYSKADDRLPHYATANWDDGINQFAEGKLLTHFVFTDALETLRRRLEASAAAADRPSRVRYLPVPRSWDTGVRHGHIEGWVLCVPAATKYAEAANELLRWFLDVEIQRNYALWGGSSAHRQIIDEQIEDEADGGAGSAYYESIRAGLEGRASVRLVKYKGPRALPAIDRIVANLYDVVLEVGRGNQTPEEGTDTLLRLVERRLRKGRG